MSLNKPNKLLIGLSILWAVLICALGSWWLYLLIILGEKLDKVSQNESGPNIVSLVKWEGSTFLISLILLSATLIILYVKDQRKTKALQDFFASLTHELKTPLASIRLQAEVINNIIENNDKDKLEVLTERMIEDTSKLETQMDKILQLSRLERGGNLNLSPINLVDFINHFKKGLIEDINIEIEAPKSPIILADEFALELIFKNLIENTKTHSSSNTVKIKIEESSQENIQLTYSDQGQFDGDHEKIGTLFYKHQSSKGSGIGVYLIKKLMQAMNGSLNFSFNPFFSSHLTFKTSSEAT